MAEQARIARKWLKMQEEATAEQARGDLSQPLPGARDPFTPESRSSLQVTQDKQSKDQYTEL